MAYDSTQTVTLQGVNTPPASTWNKLRVNDITLEMPLPLSKGEVYQRLPRLFGQLECGVGEAAVSWAVDAANDCTYVEVPAGTVRTEPIVVAVGAGEVRDTGVMVREGATASVVVVASSPEGSGASSASVVRVIAERDAMVGIVEVLALSGTGTHLEAVGVDADDGANVTVRQYFLGGGTVAAGFAANLRGDASSVDLGCRFVTGKDELLDVNHVARLRGRKTKADFLASGMLAANARKTLRETIDLVHGARGAKGNEAETVVIAGDDVVNKTLPVILCDEDDVQGNHGSTIGSIGPEQLAYLAGRGLSEEQSEELFMRAIFDDALINAGCAEARAAVLERARVVFGNDSVAETAEALGQVD